MTDPLIKILRGPQPLDPRDCKTEDEIDQAIAGMMTTVREHSRYTESVRAGVPGLLADLRRDIALAQFAHIHRLDGKR